MKEITDETAILKKERKTDWQLEGVSLAKRQLQTKETCLYSR